MKYRQGEMYEMLEEGFELEWNDNDGWEVSFDGRQVWLEYIRFDAFGRERFRASVPSKKNENHVVTGEWTNFEDARDFALKGVEDIQACRPN